MAHGIRLPEELVNQVASLCDELTPQQIADRAGISLNTVRHCLRIRGVKAVRAVGGRGNGAKWWSSHPDVDQFIRETYPAHGPTPTCEKFGLTKGSVSCRAMRLGVKCEGYYARRAKTTSDAVRAVNGEFFKNWSPNLAWLVGYTWTDGNVYSKKKCHKVKYVCSAQDEQLLHDIRAVIGCTSAIYRLESGRTPSIKGRPVRSGHHVGFAINSRLVCEFMISCGVVPNKSGHPELPMPTVPSNLLQHFARGVVDGDGSLYFTRTGVFSVAIYGGNRFVADMSRAIALATGVRPASVIQKPESEKCSYIRWSAQKESRAVASWLYPPGDYLQLKRKREKAEAAGCLTTVPDNTGT